MIGHTNRDYFFIYIKIDSYFWVIMPILIFFSCVNVVQPQISAHEKWLNHVYGLTFISLFIKSGLRIFVVTELRVQCTFYVLVIS